MYGALTILSHPQWCVVSVGSCCETSYYPSGTWNFEVASEFVENLCTPGLIILFHLLRCLYEYQKCTESVNMLVCFNVALLIVSPSKAVRTCTDCKMCSTV